MAKTKRRAARSSSKRRKARPTPARKEAAKRVAPKKVKSKARTVARRTRKPAAVKKRSPKITARKALRRPSGQTVAVPVEDTVIDVVDEPASGAVRGTEYETVRTIAAEPNGDSETEGE